MPRARCIFRKPTAESLANAALYYLSRYAASEASLRRVLQNKIRRAAMNDPAFAQDHVAQQTLAEAIGKIVETHRKTGAINDAAFAEMKVHSLRRAGRSARTIAQKLTQKGLKRDLIDQALVPEDGREAGEVETDAARAFAKRRGLGPYRKKQPVDPQEAAKQKTKDVAALARAGFAFDIIRRVLDVGDLDIID